MLDDLRASLNDRYDVERELGRGGMATVYLARDRRHDRRVAIKVLHPDLATNIGADRFLREIGIAAKLQHPHILSLYDSGAANGLLYYVMPFVEGESLRDRLERDKLLPVDEALQLIIEVAEALGYAHERGIVHRDIKPENILLSNGHAIVADFGIARAVRGAEHDRLTLTGSSLGTPLYMSPEQAAGEDAGPASDLYSLACVAVEVLTGQPPFTGSSAQAIMAKHAMEPPPSIRVVRTTVPQTVEDAIHCALAKVPVDRPKNAAAFIDALVASASETSASRSMRLRRSTAGYGALRDASRARTRWRRSAVVATLVVAAALITAAWAARRRTRAAADAVDGLDPRTVAVLSFADNSRDHTLEYVADGLSDELRALLREVPALHVISRGGAEQIRKTPVPLDSAARLLGAGTLIVGSVNEDGTDTRVDVQLVEGNSGETFARASFRRPASDRLGLRTKLAEQIDASLRARLGKEIHLRELRSGTGDVDAWVFLQRGQRERRRFDSLAAVGDSVQAWRSFAIADSLYSRAAERDRNWIEPPRERGRLAYARSRIWSNDPLVIERWDKIGIAFADSALTRDDHDPDALELRGNLRYWGWLNQIERDSARARALLMAAKADLELARTVRPSQAGAWASLSHLYYQDGTPADIKNAAQRALEADAFLSNADVILQRLFNVTYDEDDALGARDACERGVRQFPANWRFTECRLMMMTMRGVEPDPARAWRLADSIVALSASPEKPFNRLSAAIYVAGVLARAGLADSARATLKRSVGDASIDASRDLAQHAGFVYALLGDTTAAVNQLKAYLEMNPGRRGAYASDPGWWYRPVAGTLAYRHAVAR